MNLPTQLTVLRIILTPIYIICLLADNVHLKISAFVIFVLASLTDWYDGYAARKFGAVTRWGQFLDPLADKILILSGFICFYLFGLIPGWMVVVIAVRDILITCLRCYAICRNRSIVTQFIAKIKTSSQFFAIYFLFLYYLITLYGGQGAFSGILLTIDEKDFIFHMMSAITLLTVISGIVYLIDNRSHLRELINQIYRIFLPSDI